MRFKSGDLVKVLLPQGHYYCVFVAADSKNKEYCWLKVSRSLKLFQKDNGPYLGYVVVSYDEMMRLDLTHGTPLRELSIDKQASYIWVSRFFLEACTEEQILEVIIIELESFLSSETLSSV